MNIVFRVPIVSTLNAKIQPYSVPHFCVEPMS
jgi:hypothetical protein